MSEPVGQPALFEMAKQSLSLADRFLVPPFSVLDARAGYWQERKAAWLALGIQSEVGRSENLLKMSDTILRAQNGDNPKNAEAARALQAEIAASRGAVLDSAAGREDGLLKGGRRTDTGPYEGGGAWQSNGTSVFDPVLCELCYRWFSPKGGAVLDPFAGGSVRGITAAALGRAYLGIDLRPEQIAANEAQSAALHAQLAFDLPPAWLLGDSRQLPLLLEGGLFDFVFSCPPYFDLEQYSDDPRDLSNAGKYYAFKNALDEIVWHAVEALRPDRFACFVVGEVRGKDGLYQGFVPDTIRAFQAAGAAFYNEGILVTSVGSLPIRTSRIFGAGRKLGKTHQNVLVFCKGDPKKAAAACGEIREVALEYGGATVAPEEPEP